MPLNKEVILILFAFMNCMFLIGYFKKDNGLMDVGWGIGFCIIALYLFFTNKFKTGLSFIITISVLLWGLRLAIYLYIRNKKHEGEDFRYLNWRKEWGKWVNIRAYFQVYFLQISIMYIIALPIILLYSGPVLRIEWYSILGLIIYSAGLIVESIADNQMYNFKNNSANKGKIMDKGLWRYSRHPNYFGESLVWWGIFLICLNPSSWQLSIISPFLMTYLLLKVSGVAMLERKYKGNEAYINYQRSTSSFIPWFRKNT